jgi:protein-disulfide isomerase
MTTRSSWALPAALAIAMSLAVVAGGASADDPAEASGRAVQLRLESDEQARGRPDAPLTLVEFTDYQCPYCRRFEAQTWPLIKRDWVDTGRLLFIVRDLPLEFHSAARPAAEAVHCAAEQGRFWPMHDALLAEHADLTPAGLTRAARSLGVDPARFAACTSAHRYDAAIAHNAAAAQALGLHGTPAFVIGRVRDGVLQGWVLLGAQPYEDFDAALHEVLAAK